MEFNRDDLETKKYQDLVKLAKEHDVYRRYAPKTEIIDRLMELNKNKEEVNNISDISMPSLPEITDDESEAENVPVVQTTFESSKSETRSLRSRSGIVQITPKEQEKDSKIPVGNVPEEDRRLTFEVPYERSILGELNANPAKTESLRRTRRTVAFGTPERSDTLVNTSQPSTSQRRTTFATPYKPPPKTPARSAKKPGPAASTPAPNRVVLQVDESLTRLRGAFGEGQSDASPIKSPDDKRSSPAPFKREGTYEIITVDDSGRKMSREVTLKTPASPFDESQWGKRTRSGRNTSTPITLGTPQTDASGTGEASTSSRKSVKELRSLFESREERSGNRSAHSDSPALRKSPNPNETARWQMSTSRVTFASPSTSTRRSPPKRDSHLKSASPMAVLPSTSKKAYVTSRSRTGGYIKPPAPSTKKLSLAKGTPKVTIKSPSVVKEIEMIQKVVSAQKMMEATSGTKSKIPPPRRVPNFSEMHAKMYSKMESLVDVKEKIMNRAMEHNNALVPRCAATTPQLSTGKKTQQHLPVVASAVGSQPRPVAMRKLLSPKVSKIPQRAAPSPVAVRPLPASPRLSAKRSADKPKPKPQPVRKLMPATSAISRLPVFKADSQSRHSPLNPGAGNSRTTGDLRGRNEAPRLQLLKEAVVNKAPLRKVQDITGKNRQLLQSVRMNKRFDLQMQHRMKRMGQ